jgi:hypothetical protein
MYKCTILSHIHLTYICNFFFLLSNTTSSIEEIDRKEIVNYLKDNLKNWTSENKEIDAFQLFKKNNYSLYKWYSI